jgi:hypothetical protein
MLEFVYVWSVSQWVELTGVCFHVFLLVYLVGVWLVIGRGKFGGGSWWLPSLLIWLSVQTLYVSLSAWKLTRPRMSNGLVALYAQGGLFWGLDVFPPHVPSSRSGWCCISFH